MSLIQSRNLLNEIAPKTRLTSAEATGTTVLRVENSTAMVAGWAVQIGETNQEQTEVVVGTAPNVGTINVATTDFAHPADTPVYFIKYNQVVFQRSTTGTTGTATSMTDGTIEYQPDHEFTVFDDTSGSSTYGYRTLFRNSVLAVNSTQSDWQTFAGFDFYTLASIRERAKQKLWNAEYLNDETIDNWINEWKFELVNEVIAVNEDYALGTVQVGFGTDGLGTITTADFSQPRRIWITYNGNDWYQSTKMNVNDYLPTEQFTSTHPYHAWRGDTTFIVRPSDTSGTAEITFYRFGTTLVNDTDALPQPMRPYTKSFVNYVEANAYLKDGKQSEYRDKLTEAAAGKSQFVTNIVPRDKTGPTFIDLSEPITGDDTFSW